MILKKGTKSFKRRKNASGATLRGEAMGKFSGFRSNKYNNTRQGGFMSKLEAAVHQILLLREKAGELQILKCQDHVYLTDARIGCIPDFKCRDLVTGAEFWVEAKGFESERWLIIRKLWFYYGPGILEVWKGSYKKPYLQETIIPAQNLDLLGGDTWKTQKKSLS